MQTDIERAIEIALSAHSGQVDKGGQPYILHPLRVMGTFSSEPERIVAVLHDVVEDSDDWQLSDIAAAAFGDEVVEALDALTRRSGEPYHAYLDRLRENQIACRVKLADLSDNMCRERIPSPTDDDERRWAKYEAAIQRLLCMPA
jgi:(p)ppGpp synthase/HD superfamily hydrolase